MASATPRRGGEEPLDLAVGTPGRYRFVCTMHEGLGQVGALDVRR